MSKSNARLSEDPATFQDVYDMLMDVGRKVGSGSMKAEDGEVVAKAGYGAAKTIESDLHARMFAHRVSIEATGAAQSIKRIGKQ